MFISRAILVAALTVASPGLAQDAPAEPRARIVALAGYQHSSSEPLPGDDLVYGVSAGYDLVAGRAVVGGEVELSDSTQRGCFRYGPSIDDSLCFREGRDIYLGGRVGASVAPGLLVYAKAGYVNHGGTYTTATAPGRTFSYTDGRFRIGAGVEKQFGSFLLRTEYRADHANGRFGQHQVVAGAGIRF